MRIKPGQISPNFETFDIHGNCIDLHKLSHNKILLTFFRYAECALCNLRISEIRNESEKLRDLDIRLIAVFQSSSKSLIAAFNETSAFNITIISDPKLELYNLFGVRPSWIKLIKTTSYNGIKSMIKASKLGFKLGGKVEGKFHQIPADFLIGKTKKIEIAHYGNNLIDHIPIETIINTSGLN
ncbi:redoxin domain-containing protein [Costertonia aggregata]|uniref:Redoxin domain-containing protein n=1 Tax=Costertonia aggregata TaxID=343403 RepID=A0A7H9AMR1_9FLAO|nr:redoxin domain-containing protein [Costertonia aggregata]QLG44739.1 redoxin domain-containing protein [Costertonia aggregata]